MPENQPTLRFWGPRGARKLTKFGFTGSGLQGDMQGSSDELTIIAHFSLNDGMLGTASEVRLHDVGTFSMGGKQPEINTIS